MIRKISISCAFMAAVMLLTMGICACAESLDDYINNVVLVYQRYDIVNNAMYEQN